MRSSRVRALDVLSISALDLFASALGVFILMAVLLFPFYLKAPAVELALDGARQEAADANADADDMRLRVAEAEEALRSAQALLDQKSAEKKEAADALAAAQAAAKAVQPVPSKPKPRRSGPDTNPIAIGDLDLVFVMDTTGSMRHEIADLQRSLLSIIRVLDRLAPSLRIGFVAFKERTDPVPMQAFVLSPMNATNARRIQGFVRRLEASGGGDKPEPVGDALRAAIRMPWRPNAIGRIVVIGDAQAHMGEWGRSLEMAAGFRASGDRDRRVSGIFTGHERTGLDYYRQLVAAGGGDLITHRGRILESVLLSILEGART